MSTILSYLTAFGLAGGSGAKAFIPVLLLGLFHHTPYFELSDRFAWIASPPVLAVLAFLVIVEIVVDSSPSLAVYGDTVAYLPKFAAGFIAFAAATGDVDSSLLELATSGLLGGATAAGVHWVRNRIRRPLRDSAELLHGGIGKAASLLEAGASAGVASTALMAPVISLLLIGGLGGIALLVARAFDNRRVPCVHCGEPIRPGALVCIHCKAEQSEASPRQGS